MEFSNAISSDYFLCRKVISWEAVGLLAGRGSFKTGEKLIPNCLSHISISRACWLSPTWPVKLGLKSRRGDEAEMRYGFSFVFPLSMFCVGCGLDGLEQFSPLQTEVQGTFFLSFQTRPVFIGSRRSLLVERRTRDRKVASSNPGRSGGRIFFFRVDFVCWPQLCLDSGIVSPFRLQ